jgi:hypothetical protein
MKMTRRSVAVHREMQSKLADLGKASITRRWQFSSARLRERELPRSSQPAALILNQPPCPRPLREERSSALSVIAAAKRDELAGCKIQPARTACDSQQKRRFADTKKTDRNGFVACSNCLATLVREFHRLPPRPDIIVAEIADDLEAALKQFAKTAARLGRTATAND